MRVLIGSEKVDINFFQPITGQRARLRINRKEAWIEVFGVIVSPSKLGQLEGSPALRRFPVLGTGVTGPSFAWNMHRVPLRHLPRISVLQQERLKWVNHHVDFSLSDREQEIRATRLATDSLVALKLSVNTILKCFVGSAEGRYEVFVLSRANGVPELVIFAHALRLDLGSHTIVADGYALPVTRDMPKALLKTLDAVPSRHLRLSDDEMESWKCLLPALVERCRDWTHSEGCAYAPGTTVPISTEPGKSPICSCGAGRVAPDFAAQKHAAPFAAHATRIALSPLFSVSYVDPTGAAALRDAAAVPQLLRDHEVNEAAVLLLALRGGRLGQDDSDTMCKGCGVWIPRGLRKRCGACRTAVYCSEHCQREAWASHKLSCAGRTRP
ncbi:zinc finger MYND domain-containing protein [Phanerochaete sordida]|uniref:Zinc finger MYND domain-containing protein n=1 Tax=Phanerochaete sordida TaxID=48140 RepID=A0A9P3FZ90_9APHY|nr:zinc finger MYND domain-containing protein [Phanerochaete sordida]